MTIKQVTPQDIRALKGKEGLILQGCGGPLEDWVNGINDELTEEGILLDGTRMEDCLTFTNKGVICLYFPFEGAKVDLGKIAMWRLRTHGDYAGTWLTDYVDNQLGGFIDKPQEKAKPDCQLIGEDGNIFNLIGKASRALKSSGMYDEAKEMSNRVTTSGSYDEALHIIGEYVNITGPDEGQGMGGMGGM